jgi:polyhydroxyalkanoate synthesis regulator phasin
MFFKEDHTYQDICEKSVMQWLDEMGQHEDLAVRGGVRVTTDYIWRLKKQIAVLEEKNQMKDEYLKKMKKKG